MAIFDLVFEGGGAKGSAFAGALAALDEQGHTIRRVIGTSAGAITAVLVAAGYPAAEILALVREKVDGQPRFARFMDHPTADDFSEAEKQASDTMRALEALRLPESAGRKLLRLLLSSPVYAQLFSFVECGGLFAGRDLRDWLAEKLAAKGFGASDTLLQFFAKSGLDFSAIASDTTGVEMLVLNHRTAPALPVIWAVRMSMSIPFVWRQVVWEESWGLYRGRKKAGNLIVDGGVLSNFPIRLIAESNPDIMGDTDPDAALNLGLLLDNDLAAPDCGAEPISPPAPSHAPICEKLRLVQRVSCLVDTMLDAQDNDAIRQYASGICRLPVKGYGVMEFAMSDAKLKALIDGGRSAMLAHLEDRKLGGRMACSRKVPDHGTAP